MSYAPDPLHTGHVRLPRELMELREILAENVHDMWAKQRMEEGWVYGPERDDRARTHPCLVRYDQLPESEKEYDRETAVQTLRAVLAHGYRIAPPAGDATPVIRSSDVERELENLRHLVFSANPSDFRSLITRWKATAADRRWNDLDLSRRFIERLLEFNEPLVAFDFVSEGLGRWPDDLRLMQLQGMSLARAGATRKANQIFRQLCEAGHTDEETLANLARTYKTLWSETQDAEEKRSHLTAAYDAYQVSYHATHGYWSGINVAFLALMRGDHAEASEVAARVDEQCLRELDATRMAGRDVYWLTATLGEAALIRGDTPLAMQWYARATAIAGRRYGNVASTCRQARQLVDHLRLDWPQFAGYFPLPAVVVFSSATSDAWPASTWPSQPLQSTLASAMRSQLASDRHVLGFGCLRNWLDLIFLETVLQAGGDVAVLLDSSDSDRNDSERNDSAGDGGRAADFTQRAEQVLAKCSEIHYLTARAGAAAATGSEYAGKILIGLGRMQARQLGTRPVVLTLPTHDEHSEPRPDACSQPGFDLEGLTVLPLPLEPDVARSCRTSRADLRESAQRVSQTSLPILGTRPRVMALLFADVKGYSRLSEAQLITFAREFLGKVAELVRASHAPPATRHTWGDGLFFTFERIADAGIFALDLAGLIDSTNWQKLGLPEDVSIRIGLHAGPVYEYFDPVSEQRTFCGVHVNHAARIEPITPPGNVYASEAFAALASGENIRGFVCEYVGRTPLAKDFGLFSTYHVRRGAPEHS